MCFPPSYPLADHASHPLRARLTTIICLIGLLLVSGNAKLANAVSVITMSGNPDMVDLLYYQSFSPFRSNIFRCVIGRIV
jgi:hypothetical protein